MVLEVSAIVPVIGRLNEATPVRIFGTDFGANPIISVSSISAIDILVISSEEIIFTIPGTLEEGSYALSVSIGSESSSLDNAFTVVESFPEYPFTDQNFQTIQTRILSRLDSKYETFEGSLIYDFYAPLSLEFADNYLALSVILDLAYLVRARGSYLDFRGIEYGISRRKATKAFGEVTFIGTDTITVPKGTRISNTPADNITPIEFITDEDVALVLSGANNVGTVGITAVEAGSSGNFPIGSVNRIIDDIDDLTSVTNAARIIAGSDREEDEIYLSRILSQIRTPARAGNIENYKQWAREASEYVGKVGIDPLRKDEMGGTKRNGEVGVYILHPDNTSPTSTLISTVQQYIGPDDEGKGEAPIGAKATVNGATLVSTHVKVTFTASPGFIKSQITSQVMEMIEEFINDLDIGENVLYHNLATVVNNINGVESVSNYAISTSNATPSDSEISDISINNTRKAVSGTITVS